MKWRKLEPDERIKLGDFIVDGRYDMNSTLAMIRAFYHANSDGHPIIEPAGGTVNTAAGRLLEIRAAWRCEPDAEITSEPMIKERKIEMDL